MIQYSRQGLYIKRNRKPKLSMKKENKVDYMNIFLFVLLVVVIILFVVS
ncbi:MAG: hypothetical protein QW757_00120 [Candidatus Woesearchaeota archaeon]